jgi:hypothetical protein
MISIYLINSCAVFDYSSAILVENYKMSMQTKGNAIIVVYKGKELIIPLANIAAIEGTNAQ